ncbi:hypothetical protein BDV93DRAFT_483912 [Ceratobasidium sp. AG-I]|nr:hypothetical protein BDV93DRAFT_483912 [Ceratobasidium sp. AG-I]
MVFFPGFFFIAPWEKELFTPFAKSLKLVVGCSAGYDHVDVAAITKIGAYFANTPIAISEPTSMTTVILILQTVRATSQAEMNLRKGQWKTGFEFTDDLRDLTVGIVGNGRIGQLVQKKLQALGVGKIIYSNRHPLPPSAENGAVFKSLNELLAESDLITLHCPFTPETRHLLSDAQFASMKKGVYIINTSRGAVIDEAALVRAMKTGQVNRVGLDVFENEPEVHPYLMQSDRATVFPHIGSSVKRMYHEVPNESMDNLEKWLETGVPNTPVNSPGRPE